MQTLYEHFLQALAQRPVAWGVVALLLLIALMLFVLGRRTTRTRNVASHGIAVINAKHSLVINLQNSAEALMASRRACEMIKPFAKLGTVWADWQKTMQRTLQTLEQGDGHSV